MGGGGYKTGEGDQVLPLQKGGAEKGFSHAEGVGGTNSFEVVLMQVLEVLAMLKGVAKTFHLSKTGARMQKVSD